VIDTPFSYDELDELLRGDGDNDFIGLSSIDGMIAALAAGPAVVPPAEWLPMIFAGHRPSTVKGTPESRAVATIMARYAEVERGLLQRPTSYRPILMHHLGQFILRPWAIGFMMGVSTRPHAWFPVLTKKRVEMAPLLACCEVGSPMLPELSRKEIGRVAANHPAEIAAIAITVMNFHKADRLRQKTDTSWRRPKTRGRKS
jgi:yecA family protein